VSRHILEPIHGVVHDYFSRDLVPVLSVDAGDNVTVSSLDARGYLEQPSAAGAFGQTFLPGARGHALSGPIFVREAQPGHALAVTLVSLRTGTWGWTTADDPDQSFTRSLGNSHDGLIAMHWQLDPDARVGTNDLGLAVNLHPFLGVIGVAPAEEGEFSTVPPRYCGGNIDCKDLVEGSVLYLPVSVEGALLSLGDGHARQGDGEVSGTAIECRMTTEVTLSVVAEPLLPTPYAKTPTSRLTFGFDPDLNRAGAAALNAMLTWVRSLYSVTRGEALALASAVVDLRITQVANGVWGVHASLADDALWRLDASPHPA
jgi:acetamidase/formamidase